MPSLKEIKTRIASVNSTRKITSAMKMVASSKLHHAQVAIQNMLPFAVTIWKKAATGRSYGTIKSFCFSGT